MRSRLAYHRVLSRTPNFPVLIGWGRALDLSDGLSLLHGRLLPLFQFPKPARVVGASSSDRRLLTAHGRAFLLRRFLIFVLRAAKSKRMPRRKNQISARLSELNPDALHLGLKPHTREGDTVVVVRRTLCCSHSDRQLDNGIVVGARRGRWCNMGPPGPDSSGSGRLTAPNPLT